MSNKKFTDFKNPMEALEVFTQMMTTPEFSSFFGGMIGTKEKSPYENLGEGYELRPIEILAEGGQIVVENRENYSHLYHNGLKISDKVFRKGGMSNGFKDGYASLIVYTQKEEHTEKRHGFDFGIHVIVNKLGDICLSGSGISEYPSHRGGNIGKLKDTYYNLLTGQEILTCSSSGSIDSKNYIFVQHQYDWYSKNLPLGVYQIDKMTCEFTKIDDIK